MNLLILKNQIILSLVQLTIASAVAFVVAVVMSAIGWGLVEVARDILKEGTHKGIIYRTTSVSDAIARAIKEDYGQIKTVPPPDGYR